MSDDEQWSEDLEKFHNLRQVARVLFKEGNFHDALKNIEAMYELRPSERLQKKIKGIREIIAKEDESESEEEDDDDDPRSHVGDGFYICKDLYVKLYDYQKEGLQWMWTLYQKKKGGILGDDMGLGKTVQIISFLSGLYDAELIKTVLIVMPVSLIRNWEDEFERWCPGLNIYQYHGSSQREKERNLSKAQRKGGVLLTSYGTLVSSVDKLSRSPMGRMFLWDYIILDEGHKIKNPTKTTKAAHEINANHRLVLTGTPIQNNLKELWALYDFCHQGSLLGQLSTFKTRYENPINRSSEKDATSGEKIFGSKMAQNLRKLIAPYFLRRTKAETIEANKENGASSNAQGCKTLPKKNELIVWVHLSRKQIDIYENFLASDDVKTILMTTRSPLVELNVLKKICDHPRLFSKKACAELQLDGSISEERQQELLNDSMAGSVSLNVAADLLRTESGKMEVLILLLEKLKLEGHRTLVFSMSRKILDIIQKILLERNWKIMRLDGTITKMDERHLRIQNFQNDSSFSLFLLTTQVGGVGLTITAADRVVIYDPSWNPATDAQAVDRAYRIGQKNDVVVYRFITCGTIEEKIYRRQIFKDSITRQATSKVKENKDPHRYFTKSELRELFVLDNPRSSKTQVQLSKLHAHARKSTPQLDQHIRFLETLNIFGISDHDLMFQGNISEEDSVGVGLLNQNDILMQAGYLEQQVQQAQNQLFFESQQNERKVKEIGAYKTSYCPGKKTNKFIDNKIPSAPIIIDDHEPLFEMDRFVISDEEDSIIQHMQLEDDKISPSNLKALSRFKIEDNSDEDNVTSRNSKLDSSTCSTSSDSREKSFLQKIKEENNCNQPEPDVKPSQSPVVEKTFFEKMRANDFGKLRLGSTTCSSKTSPKRKNSNGIEKTPPISKYFLPSQKSSTPVIKQGSSNQEILCPDSDDELAIEESSPKADFNVRYNLKDKIEIEDDSDEEKQFHTARSINISKLDQSSFSKNKRRSVCKTPTVISLMESDSDSEEEVTESFEVINTGTPHVSKVISGPSKRSSDEEFDENSYPSKKGKVFSWGGISD